jgi:corrinoid protein of di/trimethylamine methyltransferase
MTNGEFFKNMEESIINMDKTEAAKLAKEAIRKGIDPITAIEKGFAKGIEEVGRRFEKEEIYLPELVMGAEAMTAALKILQKTIKGEGKEGPKTLGTAIAGTVQGDIHDIGKNIVCSLFVANGFKVIDLGADVSTSSFVEKAKELRPQFILLSALLTTTMPAQRDVIDALKKADMKNEIKVLVGGAPVSQEWADKIEADGYAENAIGAVNLAKRLI